MGHLRVREVAPHAPSDREQIALCLSLCVLHGAPESELNLWRAIEGVFNRKDLRIIELEERVAGR